MIGEEFIKFVRDVGAENSFNEHVDCLIDSYGTYKPRTQEEALTPLCQHVKYIVFSTDHDYYLFNLKFTINTGMRTARLIDADMVPYDRIDEFITPDIIFYYSVYETLKSFIYEN